MPRLVRVRVVCDGCRTAQALGYCISARRALCGLCSRGQTANGRIDLDHAVTALPFCERCDSAPAAVYCPLEDITLCACCDVETHTGGDRRFLDVKKRAIQPALEQRSVRFSGTSVLSSPSTPPHGTIPTSPSSGLSPDPLHSGAASRARPGVRMKAVCAKKSSQPFQPHQLQRSTPPALSLDLQTQQQPSQTPLRESDVLQATFQLSAAQRPERSPSSPFPAAPPPTPVLGPGLVPDQCHPVGSPSTLPVSGFLSGRLAAVSQELGTQQNYFSVLDGIGYNEVPESIGLRSSPPPEPLDVSKYFENAAPSPPPNQRTDLKKRGRSGSRFYSRNVSREGSTSRNGAPGGARRARPGRDRDFGDPPCRREGSKEADGGSADRNDAMQGRTDEDSAAPGSSEVSCEGRNGSGSSRQSCGAGPDETAVSPAVAAAAVAAAGEMYLLSSSAGGNVWGEPPPGLSAADLHSAVASAVANASLAATAAAAAVSVAASAATASPAPGNQAGLPCRSRPSKARVKRERRRVDREPIVRVGPNGSGDITGPEWDPKPFKSVGYDSRTGSSGNVGSKGATPLHSKSQEACRNMGSSTGLGSSVAGNGSSAGEISIHDFGSFDALDLDAFDHQQHQHPQLQPTDPSAVARLGENRQPDQEPLGAKAAVAASTQPRATG